MLEHLRDKTSLDGVRGCFPYRYGYPWPKEAVEFAITHSAGTYHCGNRHACPVCTSAFMAKRRDDFTLAMSSWISDGGFVVGQTLTMENSDALRAPKKYSDLAATWANMINRPRFKRALAASASPMLAKVMEEQLGEFGWFPHFHLVWFFSSKVGIAEAHECLEEISRIWCEAASSVSELSASLRCQYVFEIDQTSSKPLGQYLFKHGYYDLAFEPGASCLNQRSLSPFEVLRSFLHSGDLELLRRWVEFEVATTSRVRVKFTKPLKEYIQAKKVLRALADS